MPIVITRPFKEVELAGGVARNSELIGISMQKSTVDLVGIQRNISLKTKSGRLTLKLDYKNLKRGLDGDELWVEVQLGARVYFSDKKQASIAGHWSIVLRIEYKLLNNFRPEPAALKAFARTNALFNCWPYWREYCGNVIYRANLPALTLPLLHMGSKVAPTESKKRKKQSKRKTR